MQVVLGERKNATDVELKELEDLGVLRVTVGQTDPEKKLYLKERKATITPISVAKSMSFLACCRSHWRL